MHHRITIVGLFSLGFVIGACAPAEDESPLHFRNSQAALVKNAANVELTFYAQSTKAGSCAGTLIDAHTVLTAAHCVAGKTAAWVHAPYAKGDPGSWSGRATVLDWVEDKEASAQAGAADVAIVHLDSPIKLANYPVVAKSAPAAGGKLTLVQRARTAKNGKKGFFGVGVPMGAQKANDYQTTAPTGLADTGGPVYHQGKIVGVVSGFQPRTGANLTTKLDTILQLLQKLGGAGANAAVGRGAGGGGGNGGGNAGGGGGGNGGGGGTMCGCGGGGGAANAGGSAAAADGKVTTPPAGATAPAGTRATGSGDLQGTTPADRGGVTINNNGGQIVINNNSNNDNSTHVDQSTNDSHDDNSQNDSNNDNSQTDNSQNDSDNDIGGASGADDQDGAAEPADVDYAGDGDFGGDSGGGGDFGGDDVTYASLRAR